MKLLYPKSLAPRVMLRVLLLALVSSLVPGMASWADEIVLRNGKRQKDVAVVSLNPDGVQLNDGRVIGYERIQAAGLENQSEFDKLFQQLGEDLFRLQVRLERQDYENLQPHLSRLYPVFENRSSESAALVHLASFYENVLSGRWELVIRDHFRLFTISAKVPGQANWDSFPGDRQSGLSGLICPFAIPKQRVVENWESILAAYRALPQEHPSGLDFYFFQLAAMAEVDVSPELASNRLRLTSLEKVLASTLETAVTSTDVSVIENARVKFMEQSFATEDTRVHQALYFLVAGLLEAKSEKGIRNNGLLDLLRIHAEFGNETSSISAAALYQVAEFLSSDGANEEAKKVTTELLSRYPSSNFAKQLKIKATK